MACSVRVIPLPRCVYSSLSADEVYETSADDRTTHRVDFEYIKAAIGKSRSSDDEIIKYPADIYANEIWQSNLRPSAQA